LSGPRATIQSLWIGPRLSTMERLSIASFLKNDNDYHLYTYGKVDGIPSGTVVLDAREILPESRIFQYRDHPSYAGFANFFRYKLLLERGGWWADTDAVCLRPFNFTEPYAFSSEPRPGGSDLPNNGFLKAPPGSQIFAEAWERCDSCRPEDLAWGETGPRLIAELLDRFDLGRYLQSAAVFCPIHYGETVKFIEPGVVWSFGESTRAVHLWNEFWRRKAMDKDLTYPPTCPYEIWKRAYLLD
jgi:mannosyltransferase OCH1-like enzyme